MAVNFSLEQYNKALKLKDKFGTPEQIAFMNDGEKNLLTNINNYIVNFAGDYQDKIESRPISLGTGGIPETPINEKTEVEKEILTNEKKEVETKVPGIWDKIKGAFKGKDQGRGEEADRGISGKETGLPEQAPTEESKRIRGEETQDIASVRGWDELPLDDEGKRFTNLIEDTEQYLHVMDPRKYYELKEYKEHFSPDNYYKLLDVEIGRATNNIIGKMREEELKEFEQEYGYKPGSAVFDPAAAGEGTHIAMNDPANVMKEREKQEKLVSAQEDAIILDAMIEPFAELPVQQVKQFYDLTIAVLEKINPERAGMQKDFEPEIMELIRRENKVLNKKYPKTFVNAKAAAGITKFIVDLTVLKGATGIKSSAVLFGLNSAISNAPEVATGKMDEQDYIKEIGYSSLTGLAFGIASNVTSKLNIGSKVMQKTMAKLGTDKTNISSLDELRKIASSVGRIAELPVRVGSSAAVGGGTRLFRNYMENEEDLFKGVSKGATQLALFSLITHTVPMMVGKNKIRPAEAKAIVKVAKAQFNESLFKKQVTEHRLPAEMIITAEQFRDIWQTGKLTNAEEKDLVKSLGINGKKIAEILRAKRGITVTIPNEKVVYLIDKPYWQKIKKLFGYESQAEEIRREHGDLSYRIEGEKGLPGQAPTNKFKPVKLSGLIDNGYARRVVDVLKSGEQDLDINNNRQSLENKLQAYQNNRELIMKQAGPSGAAIDKYANDLQEKLESEEESQSIEIFSKESTGMSDYDEMLTGDPEYFRENKGKEFEIVEMSPEEYLEKVKAGFGKDEITGIEESSKGKIREAINAGYKIDMPTLDYSKESFTQEGRSRAAVAIDMGVEKMPVMVVKKAKKQDKVPDSYLDEMDELLGGEGKEKTFEPRDYLDKKVHELNDAFSDISYKKTEALKPGEEELKSIQEKYNNSKPRSKERREIKKLIEEKKNELGTIESKFIDKETTAELAIWEMIKEKVNERFDLDHEETEQELQTVTDEISMTLFERPGIEWSYNKPVSEVIETVLKEFEETEGYKLKTEIKVQGRETEKQRIKDKVQEFRDKISATKDTDEKLRLEREMYKLVKDAAEKDYDEMQKQLKEEKEKKPSDLKDNREAWAMEFKEFFEKTSGSKSQFKSWAISEHKKQIKNALKNKENIPENVLKEYPDIKAELNKDLNTEAEKMITATDGDIILENMEKVLSEAGFSIKNRHTSESNTLYLTVGIKDRESIKVRISDHEAKPTYQIKFGEADYEVYENEFRGDTHGNWIDVSQKIIKKYKGNESSTLKRVLSLQAGETEKEAEKFIHDFNDVHDVDIVVKMFKETASGFDNVKEFETYIKSAAGIWDDVNNRYKEDIGKTIPDNYMNYLAEKSQLILNKEIQSRKSTGSFDFEKMIEKFGKKAVSSKMEHTEKMGEKQEGLPGQTPTEELLFSHIVRKGEIEGTYFREQFEKDIFDALLKGGIIQKSKLYHEDKYELTEKGINIQASLREKVKYYKNRSIPLKQKHYGEFKEIKPDKPEIEAGEETTLKEQKKYIIDAIDDAIDEAPIAILSSKILQSYIEKFSEEELEVFWKKNRELSEKDHQEYVYINVPGDGEFMLLNYKTNLLTFKKRAGGLDRKNNYDTKNPYTKHNIKKKITQREIDEKAIENLKHEISELDSRARHEGQRVLEEMKKSSDYFRLMDIGDRINEERTSLKKKINTRKSQIDNGKEFGKTALENLKVWGSDLKIAENNKVNNAKEFEAEVKKIEKNVKEANLKNELLDQVSKDIQKTKNKIGFVKNGYKKLEKDVTDDDLKYYELKEDFENSIEKASNDVIFKAKDRIDEIAEKLANKHNIGKEKELYKRVFELVNERFGKKKKRGETQNLASVLGEEADKRISGDGKSSELGLASRVWDVEMPKEPISKAKTNKTEIINWIEKNFNISIRGKATRQFKEAGLYNTKSRLIRLQKWGELEVLMHELAHDVDYGLRKLYGDGWKSEIIPKEQKLKALQELGSLDYNKKRHGSEEGYAEFMRYYLTTNEAKKVAPTFYEHFKIFLQDNPELSIKLDKLSEFMGTWQNMGAEERILAQIDWRGEHTGEKRLKNRLSNFVRYFQTHWIDELYPFEKVMKEIKKVTGKEIRPSKDPFELATFSKSKATIIARTFVMKGAVDETGKKIGKGLSEIIEPIERTDMKRFVAYAVAQRALNLQQRGIESGFDVDDLQYFVQANENKVWNDVIEDITEWSSHLVDWVVRAGGLTENEAELIKKLNPIYIPFKRAFVDKLEVTKKKGKFANTNSGLYKIRGSGRPIINPMESLITQASEVILKAQKLRIAGAVAELSELEGLGGFITKVPAPLQKNQVNIGEHLNSYLNKLTDAGLVDKDADFSEIELNNVIDVFSRGSQYKGKDNILRLLVKGKPEFYELHPELYQALIGIDPMKLGPIVKIFSKFSHLLRLGATSLKASFGIARNPWRDAFTYSVLSKNKAAFPLKPVKGLFKELFAKEGSLTDRFKIMGGELSGMMGMDRVAAMRTYDEMMDIKLGKMGKVLHVVKRPVDSLQKLFNITEMGPRVTELEDQYKYYKKKHKDWSEEDCFIKAFNDAQDVTVNFTKGGSDAKVWNEVSAFFKISILGPEKVYRSFRDRPIATIIKGLTWVTLLSIANWIRNRDEEWYQNLPPAYKYSNFWFEVNKETITRLPIPFDVGIIFSAAPLAGLDYLVEKDEKALEYFKDVVVGQIPDPTPTLFQPMIDVGFNKNYLGVPIETKGDEYKYVTERSREYTSKTAKILSKIMDKMGGEVLSPIQIDYMINSYTGGLLRQFDWVTKKPEQMVDAPVLSDLLLRMPNQPRRQLNEFFDRYEVLSQKANSDLITDIVEIKEFSFYKDVYKWLLVGKEDRPGKLKLLAALDKNKDKDEIDETYKLIRRAFEILNENVKKFKEEVQND